MVPDFNADVNQLCSEPWALHGKPASEKSLGGLGNCKEEKSPTFNGNVLPCVNAASDNILPFCFFIIFKSNCI